MRNFHFIFLTLFSALFGGAGLAAETLGLSGEWNFALDRNDAGLQENWAVKKLPDKIKLPGVLQAQGYGDEISTNTPWVLSLYDKNWFQREDYKAYAQPGNVKVPFVCQPPRHYLGAAWYQRDIEIPTNWIGRRVELFLERTRWETRAWLDDRLLGTNNSLCVPHEFEAGVVGTEPNQIKPGKHRLTVRCDNRMLMAYRPDAHAVSDSLNSTWNGIVGKIELRSTPLVWIEEVQVWPSFDRKSAVVEVRVGNATGKRGKGMVRIWNGGMTNTAPFPDVGLRVNWDANKDDYEPDDPPLPLTSSQSPISRHGIAKMELPVLQGWDEFTPALHKVKVQLIGDSADETREVKFGCRDFKTSGRDFVINGRPTHLRGTHHGGDFALTGYPPCDVEYWLKLFRTCKEWGLNHVRFHSFCPPEAAFTAADEVGIYLQIEPGMWNTFNPDSDMEAMLYAETERIIKAYGNHPSFVMLAASNEPKGRWPQVLPRWAEHFRAADPRRLYTTGTGFTDSDAPGPLDRVDFTATQRFGRRQVRGASGWFGRDYSDALAGVKVPAVAHEVGQWCAYPDYDVIKKFTGYMRPGNYEIFRDSAEEHGLLGEERRSPTRREGEGQIKHAGSETGAPPTAYGAHGVTRPTTKDFAWASGRFQLACYKEDIEANLRTPGLAGFQLLDLHDYVGQGTALVGVLDPFWESKGYVEADEWRQFCSPVVPLARLTKRVFTTADKFEVPIEVANYGTQPFGKAKVGWAIRDARGKIFDWSFRDAKGSALTKGGDGLGKLALGRSEVFPSVNAELSKLPAPGRYDLEILITDSPPSVEWVVFHTNRWNFWVYPAQIDSSVPTNVLLTSSWDEAEAKLAAGGHVVFQPPLANLDWSSPPLDKLPVFWNRLMGPGWSRMFGIWCDTNHPALAGFPTEANCDWQWTEIIKTRAINLDRLPRELSPIVSAIDDWNRNWKLGLIFEAKVGQGKLLVTSFDLNAESPVAKQLRRSLLDYAASEKFQPKVEVAAADMRELWFDTLVMRKLGATVQAGGENAAAVIDGDPNSYWLVGAPVRGRSATAPRPHELTVSFPQPVTMNGVALMPRQNDRDHQGDIRGYAISVSDDGQSWREVARGELASTWNPQTIRFAQSVMVKQLKFTSLSGFGADASSGLAEIAILYAGPKLPENGDGKMQYKRAKSTSSDIDEGGN